MKKFTIACAALVVVASMAASASAADAVSKSTLSSMGFSSMQQISDTDGLAIRGKGTSASVWGESTVAYRGQNAVNGYEAAASHKHPNPNRDITTNIHPGADRHASSD